MYLYQRVPRYQQQSQRRRLLALKAIGDGQGMIDVCRSQGVPRKTLEQWLDLYLHGGFDALLAPQRRARAQTHWPTGPLDQGIKGSRDQGIKVEFLHTPVYSPSFKPAEYLIHRVRQNSLYHLPPTVTVQERAERIRRHLAQAPPQTPQQIDDPLHPIYRLPKSG